MGWFSSKEEKSLPKVPWQKLTEVAQLDDIIQSKKGEKHILFKHSTRCSISAMALNRFQNDWSDEFEDVNIWYIDLISFRDISNAIAEKTGVQHQSPQAIAVQDGAVKYTSSHGEINLRRASKSFEG